jgi:hypothetical protein
MTDHMVADRGAMSDSDKVDTNGEKHVAMLGPEKECVDKEEIEPMEQELVADK